MSIDQNKESMIKFFHKIRRKLLNEGKIRKYLIYALGEILLIVTGILIALQINNWNENQKTRIKEIKLLSQLHDALDLEIADLEFNINAIEKTINCISIIQKHLKSDLPYNDSLSYYFGNSASSVGYIVKPAVFENLKSSGLDLISNDSLRNKIITHYDYITSYLTEIEKIIVYNHQNLIIEPAMIKKFDYSWFLNPAVPNDYAKLKEDKEYLSLLKTNSEIRSFQLRRTRLVLDSAFGLQAAIEKDLMANNQ